jgi:hypothetical protein
MDLASHRLASDIKATPLAHMRMPTENQFSVITRLLQTYTKLSLPSHALARVHAQENIDKILTDPSKGPLHFLDDSDIFPGKHEPLFQGLAGALCPAGVQVRNWHKIAGERGFRWEMGDLRVSISTKVKFNEISWWVSAELLHGVHATKLEQLVGNLLRTHMRGLSAASRDAAIRALETVVKAPSDTCECFIQDGADTSIEAPDAFFRGVADALGGPCDFQRLSAGHYWWNNGIERGTFFEFKRQTDEGASFGWWFRSFHRIDSAQQPREQHIAGLLESFHARIAALERSY